MAGTGALAAHRPGAPRGRLAVPTRPGPGRSWQTCIRARPEAVLDDYAVLDGAELDRPLLLAGWTRTRSARSPCTTWTPASCAGRRRCPGSAAPVGSASGRRAATRPGSATPTTPRQ